MGNLSGATTEHVKPDMFDQTLSVNARGTMLILRAVSAAMAKQEPREHKNRRSEGSRSLGRGSIVVVGSINSIMAAPGMLSYCASKWAVLGMAKTAGESGPLSLSLSLYHRGLFITSDSFSSLAQISNG